MKEKKDIKLLDSTVYFKNRNEHCTLLKPLVSVGECPLIFLDLQRVDNNLVPLCYPAMNDPNRESTHEICTSTCEIFFYFASLILA